jgi:hypothetical protein
VVVVSPFPFQAAFDYALSSTVGETPHPIDQGLLPGRRPFHHIPAEPPVHHHHRTAGLCRFCSGARTLARRAPTRPRVSRRGDFPQRPAVADSDHRQLPSTSWHPANRLGGKRPRVGTAKQDNPLRSRRGVTNPSATGSPASSETAKGALALPLLVPCLLLRRGQVCLPGPEGPVRVRSRSGKELDPFDVIDRLRPDYTRLYLVDLDGIERGNPQLEYMQELSRDMELWVDAGVTTADSAIDILVAGAQRAVLSSSYLRSPVELRRAWKLSTDWAFEVELVGGVVQNAAPTWSVTDATSQILAARATGITDVIVSPRQSEPDWGLIRSLASGGPTWVDGTFETTSRAQLAESGAAGGIFHIDRILADLVLPPDGSPETSDSVSPRDDED